MGTRKLFTAFGKMNYKTKIAGIIAGLGGLLTAGTALGANFVEITADDLATTTAYITNLFDDVSVFVWLAIGLPLGFYVIKKVVSIIRGRTS